ncbi:hypothetical protein [Lacrimispora sp. 210928-DFI.3.58]|uniref:hypothetical protein n=1 Tax=Lacrimispora sp. 210928-DFI.3.58 TaxID=2883214 RepID=UPI001D0679B9|nr:hypothetical protein [Lacrimispora sp. 210928-DFI.3.58]MCB7321108.1 hypothetical protein [Lacrimispora sp. 210928-DFI.3.58]
MKWDTRVEENGQQPYSSVENLLSVERYIPPYAYCLPRYAKMDGVYANAPDEIEPGGKGYISAALSGPDGEFAEPPVITVIFDRLKTSNGIFMTFNRISGDYASRINIVWYKDSDLVWEQGFEPDGMEYFCRAKVPLFNRLIITFLATSRPCRYLWLAALKNQRMMDAGGLKIVYDDIALGAAEDNTAATEDKDYYVDLQDLKKDIEFPDYALCLPRYAKMDGDYINAPDELEDLGYVSDSISDSIGEFETPPSITFTFTQNYSSVGITLTFNDYSGDYCSKVNIKWYRDDELLADREYTPDSYNYFCYGIVDYYNKVVVTFLETSKPYRNVFLTGIIWGLIRVFKDDEIEDISCLMELNPISEEVSINTMGYTIRSKSEYIFEFQKRQKQTLYFDEAILGIFYLKDGKQLGAKRYSVETQDAVGLLDSSQFMGGVYNGILVSELLDKIMEGEGIAYFIDDACASIKVSGYLPICSKRNALQQLAFAIGGLVDTSYDRQLYIYPQMTEVVGEFTERDIFQGLTVEHSDIITGIRLYVHSYSAGTDSAELYKGVLNGTTKIEFSEPYHSLTVTGGTLGEYGDNYAYIVGNGQEVVLSGLKYNHSTSCLLRENPQITQNKNIAEIKEATLVTSDNAQTVLDQAYRYYSDNERVSFRAVINDQELGDRVNVATGFKGTMTGTIRKLDFKFSRRKITAEVTVG